MNKYELYLGRTTTDGKKVDLKQAVEFLRLQTLGVLHGLTIIPCFGIWQGVVEPSIQVVCLSDADNLSILSTIGKTYCSRFQQQSVLMNTQESAFHLLNE